MRITAVRPTSLTRFGHSSKEQPPTKPSGFKPVIPASKSRLQPLAPHVHSDHCGCNHDHETPKPSAHKPHVHGPHCNHTHETPTVQASKPAQTGSRARRFFERVRVFFAQIWRSLVADLRQLKNNLGHHHAH